MKLTQQIRYALHLLRELPRRLDKLEQAVGNIQAVLSQQSSSNAIRDHEFQVYSQSGEDGIIQFLIERVPIVNPLFVEFGVERYTEANTRFLLTRNYWSGLVIDGSLDNIDFIKRDPISWQQTLLAVHAFINKDNINELITSQGISGEIGLLSVDIDGNDYWVWEAINSIDPMIVICEYNSLFGPCRKVTIPYQQDFIRHKAHYSQVYYGASISALAHLAQQKGYVLVGSNSRGNNVFFVKEQYSQPFQILTPQDAYIRAQFRESLDVNGNLSFFNFTQALEQIKALPLYDIETDSLIQVKDLG